MVGIFMNKRINYFTLNDDTDYVHKSTVARDLKK